MKKLPKAYYALLEQLQAIDFVITELVLYLDTHPHDADAIAQHNQHVQQREMLRAQFESQFGPLTSQLSLSGYPWQWKESPWPWQV